DRDRRKDARYRTAGRCRADRRAADGGDPRDEGSIIDDDGGDDQGLGPRRRGHVPEGESSRRSRLRRPSRGAPVPTTSARSTTKDGVQRRAPLKSRRKGRECRGRSALTKPRWPGPRCSPSRARTRLLCVDLASDPKRTPTRATMIQSVYEEIVVRGEEF